MSENKGVPTGLLAIGRAGEWVIEVDESTAGPDRYFAQLEAASFSVQFEIQQPSVFAECLAYLLQTSEQLHADGISFGQFGETSVTIRKDDEYPDRFFICLGEGGTSFLQVTVAGKSVESFVAALKQIVTQLNE